MSAAYDVFINKILSKLNLKIPIYDIMLKPDGMYFEVMLFEVDENKEKSNKMQFLGPMKASDFANDKFNKNIKYIKDKMHDFDLLGFKWMPNEMPILIFKLKEETYFLLCTL